MAHFEMCQKCAKNVPRNVPKMCQMLVYTLQYNFNVLKTYKISATQQYYKTYSVSEYIYKLVQMTESSAHVSPVYSLTLFDWSFASATRLWASCTADVNTASVIVYASVIV